VSVLSSLRRVGVGSTNPPKLAGVRAAIAPFADAVEVSGCSVASGVSEQPVGFEEIVAGARQRALGAEAAGEFDLVVGYEDGLVELAGTDGTWFNVGCAAVRHDGAWGLGFSSGFAYPPDCAEPAARSRAPIGDLFDQLWKSQDFAPAETAPSALSTGNVGKLTGGALPRAEYTRHAVLCALAPLLHPGLFVGPVGPVATAGRGQPEPA